MSFKIANNQSNVPKFKCKYDFYCRVNHKRYTDRVISSRSTVEKDFVDWKQAIESAYERSTGITVLSKLDEYLDWVKATKSPNNYQHIKTICDKVLREYFKNDQLIIDIKAQDIKRFAVWRKTFCAYEEDYRKREIVSNNTVNHSINVLSSFFCWAIDNGLYEAANPCSRARLSANKKLEVRLSRSEIQQLLVTALKIDKQFYHIIMCALHAGLRRGEILSLTWREVHEECTSIMLSAQKTKSGKAGIVPLTASLKDILIDIKSNPYSVNDKVFSMSETMLKKRWYKLMDKLPNIRMADGTLLHFHSLRHVCAQLLIDSGVDLLDVQAILRHAHYSTTQDYYAMFARPDLAKKVLVLDDTIGTIN